MRQILVFVGSVVVSAALLLWIVQDVPLQEVGQALAQASLIWIGICLLISVSGMWARSNRWRGLLQNRINARDGFFIIAVTFLLNQLPLRAGEVARSLLAAQRGVPVMTAATSIVVERLLDLLLVVVLLAGAVTQIPDAQPEIIQGAAFLGALGVIGFGVLLFFAHRPNVAQMVLDIVHRILPFLKRLPLQGILDNVIDGLQPLTNWRTFGHALLWTLISWAHSLGAMYALVRAMGITENALLLATLGVTLASFSVAIPLSVAAIGPFEAAIAVAAQLVGLNEEVTYVALGFLTHGVTVLSYILVGGVGLVVLGVSVGDVFKRAQEEEKEKSAPEPA